MIWLTSDTHFFHDREFIYKPRNFSSCQGMNECYLKEFKRVQQEDDLYIIGDFCLGTDFDAIKDVLNHIKGKAHLLIGNHDTDAKLEFYINNHIDVKYADMITYKKRRFYLSHYPTEVAALESNPKTCIINCHGHIHTKNKFHEDKPYLYNVSVDANENRLVTLDEVLERFNAKVRECEYFLRQRGK